MRTAAIVAIVALAPIQAQHTAIDLSWGVDIPMRDGVRLKAIIFKPKATTPLPVIFTLTPYASDAYIDRASYFARNGYIFALVDVRGRGNSQGQFEPFVNDGRDGYDIVEWLARQPWSNGKIAMWGGSYAGFDQWATLKESPPHLATIVPASATVPNLSFLFYKNIFSAYMMRWLALTSGATDNNQLFSDNEFWTEKLRDRYTHNVPFQSLDAIVGNTTTVFQKWIGHPEADTYWDAMYPTPQQFARMQIPILTITGDYDEAQPGAMRFYRDHIRYGSSAASTRHFLVIGPWDHAGTRTPKREVMGLKFGPASMVDMNLLHKEWYDWTMKDGAKPQFLKDRVAYYLVEAEEWKYQTRLEEVAPARRKLYLNSKDGLANDVFRAGTLDAENPVTSAPDHYVYDPLDLRPGELRTTPNGGPLTDQTDALNSFGNGLIYHSAPFPENTEITGNIRLEVWMAMDVPDTDFEVKLYEILPNGGGIMLTRDLLRARYRDSLRKASFVRSGDVVRYEFDGFKFFSRRITKGSRLRLILRSPNSVFIQKNYNSGGVVAAESAKDARTAHITMYHDAQHPSFVEFPVTTRK